ncbi:hypothetical protein SEVIR_1G319500v4 [Setaria viridis]|uniref:Uncharacterized protein n=1 Tax=Setaria viridis TaxID=4556 RepID=A0A4V6DDE6_SETVI|nr:hypothetical protein SEVIR_1G319500v2 [Setaria viridis]
MQQLVRMAMARKSFVLPLLMAVLMLLVVSGSARRLEGGDNWAGGEAASSFGHPIIQFLKRLYLQQLSGPCLDPGTNNPTAPPSCPPHP